MQEAQARGLPIGSGLGLWGDSESGVLGDATRTRTLTTRVLDSSAVGSKHGQSAT